MSLHDANINRLYAAPAAALGLRAMKDTFTLRNSRVEATGKHTCLVFTNAHIVPALTVCSFGRRTAACGLRTPCDLLLASCLYPFSILNACVQECSLNPGMHHSMQRGSIARAALAVPMSQPSHPNALMIPATTCLACGSFPQ